MKKKIFVLLLASVMTVSVAACGENTSANDNNKTINSESTESLETEDNSDDEVTKESLVASVDKVYRVYDLQRAIFENKAKAKQTYCNIPIALSGEVLTVEEDHVVMIDGLTGAIEMKLDAYLESEELLQISAKDKICVIGIIEDIQEDTSTSSGYSFTVPLCVMEKAYIYEPEVEVDWEKVKKEVSNDNSDFVDNNIDYFTQLSGEELTDIIVGEWFNTSGEITMTVKEDGSMVYGDGSNGTWEIKEFNEGSRFFTWTDWRIYHIVDNFYYMRGKTNSERAIIVKGE